MSQEPLNLRRSIKIVRQHKILVGGLTAAGLAVGTAYAVLSPTVFTSEALVVLPQPQSAVVAAQAIVATQAVLADSDPVLAAALPNVRPVTSLDNLRTRVQATGSTTSTIITISAHGPSATDAEDTANAVANSYVNYASGAGNPLGRIDAKILEPATVASSTGPVKKFGLGSGGGVLAGLLIGFIAALAVGRSDRRLGSRDEIANSIGVPVLASFPVGHPTGAEGWTRILDEYEPGVVHAWRLRNALEQLAISGDADGNFSVTVMSISSDPRALAIGPQLAVFAASLGIWTTLVIGPQQDTNVSATLQTACRAAESSAQRRPRNFRALVSEDGQMRPDKGLTVVVTVLDPRNPEIPPSIRTNTTVFGVSAGVATAEQLALIAVAAARDGREISGILVADPDPEDRTTGRIPYFSRPVQRKSSQRTAGIPSENKREQFGSAGWIATRN